MRVDLRFQFDTLKFNKVENMPLDLAIMAQECRLRTHQYTDVATFEEVVTIWGDDEAVLKFCDRIKDATTGKHQVLPDPGVRSLQHLPTIR